MAFQVGKQKTGGRQKGVGNKVSIGVQTTIESCLSKSLPEAILERLEELELKDQVYVLLDLMNYCYPKRSAVNFGALTEEEAAKLEAYRKMSREELVELATAIK